MSDKLSIKRVADILGYKLPLDRVGHVRWEDKHGFSFVQVSRQPDRLAVSCGHVGDYHSHHPQDQISATLLINDSGQARSFILDAPEAPAVVLSGIKHTVKEMGDPVKVKLNQG